MQRWEAGHCYPTATRFLEVRFKLRPEAPSWLERFLPRAPTELTRLDANGTKIVPALLRHLRGNVPIVRIAELSGQGRFSVSRWLEGDAAPRLPDFLRLVQATSRRLLDFVAALEDPARLPAVQHGWERLRCTRDAAYECPISHGVLRALELEGAALPVGRQSRWLATRLGVSVPEVSEALELLCRTGQVKRTSRGYRLLEVTAVDTSLDPERARALKVAWTQTALERLRGGAPGNFGYSVFAVSREDLKELQKVQLQYIRAMQDIISRSTPSECVGLYCTQLLDLEGLEGS